MSIERSEPPNTPERQSVPERTRRELSVVADTAERVTLPQTKERPSVVVRDPFLAALHLPPTWAEDQTFLNAFNKSVIDTIDELQPNSTNDETVARYNAMRNELKRRLGLLPETATIDGAQITGLDMLQYVASGRANYPGRLAFGDKKGLEEGDKNGAMKYRVWLMGQAVYLFANERMAVGDIVEQRFGGNEQATMLLKGGIAEILHTRTEHDKASHWKR